MQIIGTNYGLLNTNFVYLIDFYQSFYNFSFNDLSIQRIVANRSNLSTFAFGEHTVLSSSTDSQYSIYKVSTIYTRQRLY